MKNKKLHKQSMKIEKELIPYTLEEVHKVIKKDFCIMVIFLMVLVLYILEVTSKIGVH